MSSNFTAKAYYIFMLLLPLIFYSGIADRVLLPRHILLSAFVLILIASVWKHIPKDKTHIRIDSAHVTMLIFLAIATVISIINAVVISESVYVLMKWWIAVSFCFVTVFLLRHKVISQKQLIKAVVIFGCASVVTALIDIAFKSTQDYHILRGVHVISGGFANKNLLASILFLCLPFFMIGFSGKRPSKILSSAGVIAIVVVLIILRTRIAMIATAIFFVMSLTIYFRSYIKRRTWLVIGVCFVLSLIIFFTIKALDIFGKPQSPTDVMRQYFNRLISTHTLRERILFWQNSIEMFFEYPMGVGLGNWQIYFPKYGLDKFGVFEIVNGTLTLQRPHNDFLWMLCETGIIGFTAFIGIFAIILYKAWKLIGMSVETSEKWIAVCVFSGVIGFMITSFFDFPLERIEHLVVLMLLFALVIHQYEIKVKNAAGFSVKKNIVICLLAAGAFLSLTIAYKRSQSETHMFKMYAYLKDGNMSEAISQVENAEHVFYKIDSRSIPLQWYKGVAKFSNQEYEESAVCFENAYSLTPYNIHAINNLASCYEVRGRREEAIACYRKALKISPKFEESRLNLAAVYFNGKEYEKAFRTIDSCSVKTLNYKYILFRIPILKAKVDMILEKFGNHADRQKIEKLKNIKDFSPLYFESKRNNVTFEEHVIRQLKN